jgi:hypothetical protein
LLKRIFKTGFFGFLKSRKIEIRGFDYAIKSLVYCGGAAVERGCGVGRVRCGEVLVIILPHLG